MPSRKKAQGKARKAAKAEISAEATRKKEVLETQLQRLLPIEKYESCLRGYDQDYVCAEFVKHFMEIVGQIPMEGNPHGVATEVSRKKYPLMWQNEHKLVTIKMLLLAMGTNCVLSGDIDLARQCASCAHFFKIFVEDIFHEGRAMMMGADKNTELFLSDEHTLVRYLQKHIPCSCLDNKYEEVKGVKKMGFCSFPHCKIPDRMAERSTMLYCTRCRQTNYCSRECQESHWRAGHKEDCDDLRKQRKAYKSSRKS